MTANEKAASYLARSSRTEKEVRLYLKRKGFDEAEIAPVIDEFKEYGYINDRKYCRLFFRYGMEKGWGKYRIFMELEKKGIPKQISEMEFEDYLYENSLPDDYEYTKALEIAEKILRDSEINCGYLPDRLKGRIMRRLNSYGYERQTIYKAVSDVERRIARSGEEY